MLRITGHFSYVDKYNKLVFTWLEDDSRAKLANHCEGNMPFDNDGYTVSLPMKQVPADIRAKVGLDCTLHVKLTKYDFVSKLERNYGERVNGTKLTLLNIRAGVYE